MEMQFALKVLLRGEIFLWRSLDNRNHRSIITLTELIYRVYKKGLTNFKFQ